MKKIRAHALRINDIVINKGMIAKIEKDGHMVGVTYDDGSRTRYEQNARLIVQDLTDTTQED